MASHSYFDRFESGLATAAKWARSRAVIVVPMFCGIAKRTNAFGERLIGVQS